MVCLLRMVSFGMEDFAEKYGALKPFQFVDVISLAGDKSDNIPGYFVILFVKLLSGHAL
jgi:5'-3' exonuclease